jgi:hypothetical protein
MQKFTPFRIRFVNDISISRSILWRIKRFSVIFIELFFQFKHISFLFFNHLLVFFLLLDVLRIMFSWRSSTFPWKSIEFIKLSRIIHKLNLSCTSIFLRISFWALICIFEGFFGYLESFFVTVKKMTQRFINVSFNNMAVFATVDTRSESFYVGNFVFYATSSCYENLLNRLLGAILSKWII